MSAETPRIIAHRGASGHEPENTLRAISRGWELGADGVEVDVRLTRDGTPVIIHDRDTFRVTGIKREVADCSIDELRELRVRMGSEEDSEEIPTLAQVVDALPDGKLLFVELKESGEMVERLEPILNRTEGTQDLVLLSFLPDLLTELKASWPPRQIMLLVDEPLRSRQGDVLNEAASFAKRAGLAGLGLGNSWRKHPKAISSTSLDGLALAAWTVNSPSEASEWEALGARFIITDFPDRLAK